MKSMTLQEAIAVTGKDVYEWLDREAEVPAVSHAACQGHVSILRVTTRVASTPIPSTGVVVVQAEAGGHTHSLYGAGFFDRAVGDGLTVGTLTVPMDTDVLLSHPEHGALLFAPGTYRIGRQREYAGEWRTVAD